MTALYRELWYLPKQESTRLLPQRLVSRLCTVILVNFYVNIIHRLAPTVSKVFKGRREESPNQQRAGLVFRLLTFRSSRTRRTALCENYLQKGACHLGRICTTFKHKRAAESACLVLAIQQSRSSQVPGNQLWQRISHSRLIKASLIHLKHIITILIWVIDNYSPFLAQMSLSPSKDAVLGNIGIVTI